MPRFLWGHPTCFARLPPAATVFSPPLCCLAHIHVPIDLMASASLPPPGLLCSHRLQRGRAVCAAARGGGPNLLRAAGQRRDPEVGGVVEREEQRHAGGAQAWWGAGTCEWLRQCQMHPLLIPSNVGARPRLSSCLHCTSRSAPASPAGRAAWSGGTAPAASGGQATWCSRAPASSTSSCQSRQPQKPPPWLAAAAQVAAAAAVAVSAGRAAAAAACVAAPARGSCPGVAPTAGAPRLNPSTCPAAPLSRVSGLPLGTHAMQACCQRRGWPPVRVMRACVRPHCCMPALVPEPSLPLVLRRRGPGVSDHRGGSGGPGWLCALRRPPAHPDAASSHCGGVHGLGDNPPGDNRRLQSLNAVVCFPALPQH